MLYNRPNVFAFQVLHRDQVLITVLVAGVDEHQTHASNSDSLAASLLDHLICKSATGCSESKALRTSTILVFFSSFVGLTLTPASFFWFFSFTSWRGSIQDQMIFMGEARLKVVCSWRLGEKLYCYSLLCAWHVAISWWLLTLFSRFEWTYLVWGGSFGRITARLCLCHFL